MSFPKSITEKITPFIESFDIDLNRKLVAIDRQASTNGLLNGGSHIQSYGKEFIETFITLLDKIVLIIFTDLKNKNQRTPGFAEVRKDIMDSVQPKIGNFKNQINKKFDMISATILNNFMGVLNKDFENQIDKRFVDYELQFDKDI